MKEGYMVHKSIVGHELGHAVSAAVQDLYVVATDLDFEPDLGGLAYCNVDTKKKKKPNILSPYKKYLNIMDLGGIYGELLILGMWSPWGARADLDDFSAANKKLVSDPFIKEIDDWLWIDDDDYSFRACTRLIDDKERRKFWMDHHDTFTRMPYLFDAYIDFCDRIDKEVFKDEVDRISKLKSKFINTKQLKIIIKGII